MSSAAWTSPVCRIVSGGQTGVDQGALDAAIGLGVSHAGWCPRGRIAENGTIPRRFQLTESHSAKYRVRTEQNVQDSDGTLILYRGTLSGGTEFTQRMAIKHGRPHFLVDLDGVPCMRAVRDWLQQQAIETLNVAGPRESNSPGIFRQARDFVTSVLND